MTPEQRKKINNWFEQEIGTLKAQGASPEDLAESSIVDLIVRKALTLHHKEIVAEPALMFAVFELWLESASPEALREIAAEFRKYNAANAAYDLELLADVRERGEGVNNEPTAS